MAERAVPPAGAAPVLRWPGMRSEYAWVRPHADTATVTGAHQIGISFSGHRRLAYTGTGAAVTADIAPGSTIVSGPAPISWLRVREVTEALEIYLDPALVGGAEIVQRVGEADGTVLGIGSVLRQAHAGGDPLGDVAASTLAHRLAAHLLTRYGGAPPQPRGPGLLDHRTVDRVTGYVESTLHGVVTLDELAAVVRLSPFHFARAFARTTGLPPHRFVTARRMDRARALLWTTDRSVEEVAAAVGYGNLSHFRRVFRRQHGVRPSDLRG